jgi:uncharacterized DUF497 family protein
VRLADDPGTRAWLEGEPKFEWDAGNLAKNAKHDVTRGDIEAVMAIRPAFVGRILEPAHDEPRWLLLGRDTRGRGLALIFTRRGDLLRPISCRPMRENERTLYEQAQQAQDPQDR